MRVEYNTGTDLCQFPITYHTLYIVSRLVTMNDNWSMVQKRSGKGFRVAK